MYLKHSRFWSKLQKTQFQNEVSLLRSKRFQCSAAVNKEKPILQTDCTDLKLVMERKVSIERERVKIIREEFGSVKIGDITVDSLYGGMRGMKALVWETSCLDPEEGIRFRGLSIPECLELLPRGPGEAEPMPEGLFWLLLTGDVPSYSQAVTVTNEWNTRAELPPYMIKFLDQMPPGIHPMAQFSSAITILSRESRFNAAYDRGIHKADYWKYIYEDSMDLIAKLPVLASVIYNNTYRNKRPVAPLDSKRDWSENFARMLGYPDPKFAELMRLYLTIHSDHEGGNVSAHAVNLVGSALSDPYKSFAAGINGLAGPLHGLANQEVLVWLCKLQNEIGTSPSDDRIRDFVLATLKRGQVIPGYGHAVLRITDPRYTCQREFASKHAKDSELFRLVSKLYEIVPPVLKELGRVKNPWPNVDAHSGVLLQHFGMREINFYTVLFGVSRSLGTLSQLIWSRALGLPIERPKSVPTVELHRQLRNLK